MPEYEYKVVPAPAKGTKARGVKTPEARFAHTLETLMNELAAEGWEYQRADLLPSEERQGLTGSTTNWRNVLVFRRAKPDRVAQTAPQDIAARPPDPAPARIEPPLSTATAAPAEQRLGKVSGMTAALRARAAAAASFGIRDKADGRAEGGGDGDNARP